jgi:hypothetical protein
MQIAGTMSKYVQRCLWGAAIGLAISAGQIDIAAAQAAAAQESQPGATVAESTPPRARSRSDRPGRAAQPRAGGQVAYDGLWSVLIITDNGPCDRTLRYPIRITRGIVRHAQGSADALFSISGQVNPSGAVSVVVSGAGHRADGTGRLAGNEGGGSWQASGGLCSGRWTAARRG